MDINSHTFNLPNLKQLILESNRFGKDSTRKKCLGQQPS